MNLVFEENISHTLIFAILFGLIMGIFYSALSVFVEFFGVFVKIPLSVKATLEDIGKIKSVFREKYMLISEMGNAKRFIRDFIFVITYGILFSILLYITCDGMIRGYILIISLSVSYVSERMVGRHLCGMIVSVMNYVFAVTVAIIALSVFPIRSILMKCLLCISPLRQKLSLRKKFFCVKRRKNNEK